MTQHRSINETLDAIAELNGQAEEVEGILGTSFEGTRQGYALFHYPKAERRADTSDDGRTHAASLWLEFGDGSIEPNRSLLTSWLGKRVRVHGVVFSNQSPTTQLAIEGESSFDPWGIWRAYVEVYSIQRVTSVQRKENGA